MKRHENHPMTMMIILHIFTAPRNTSNGAVSACAFSSSKVSPARRTCDTRELQMALERPWNSAMNPVTETSRGTIYVHKCIYIYIHVCDNPSNLKRPSHLSLGCFVYSDQRQEFHPMLPKSLTACSPESSAMPRNPLSIDDFSYIIYRHL